MVWQRTFDAEKEQPDLGLSPGQWLRELRPRRGLKMKDVEDASAALAQAYDNDEFRVSASRLSEIENLDLTPNIFKLYSLAAIYRVSYAELLKVYGVDADQTFKEFISPQMDRPAARAHTASR